MNNLSVTGSQGAVAPPNPEYWEQSKEASQVSGERPVEGNDRSNQEEELAQSIYPKPVQAYSGAPVNAADQNGDELGIEGQKPQPNELLRERGQQFLERSLAPTGDGGAQMSPDAKPVMNQVGSFMDTYQDVYGTPSTPLNGPQAIKSGSPDTSMGSETDPAKTTPDAQPWKTTGADAPEESKGFNVDPEELTSGARTHNTTDPASKEKLNESRTTAAEAALDTHAQRLEQDFSDDAAWQGFLADTFGNNPVFQEKSAEELGALRDDFISGRNRPEIATVPADTLVDANSEKRPAAYDSANSRIMLSDELDPAAAEKAVNQELGHWWDQQINGERDTRAADGTAFDEGAAFAERLQGRREFSDAVYTEDTATIQTEKGEIQAEFAGFDNWRFPVGTNTHQLSTNCYFCTVAALAGVDTDTLVNATGNMQYDTNTIEGTLELFHDAGARDAAVQRYGSAQEAYDHIMNHLGIADGQAVGIAYGRPATHDNPTGIGHMEVAVRDNGFIGDTDGNGAYRRSEGLYLLDYQQTPPTRTAFPPEDYVNGQPIYVFYRDPNQVNNTPSDYDDMQIDVGVGGGGTRTTPAPSSTELHGSIFDEEPSSPNSAGGALVTAIEAALMWMIRHFTRNSGKDGEL